MDSTISARINLDDIAFREAISRIQRNLRLVRSEFSESASRIGTFGASTERLRLRVTTLNRQIELQSEQVDELRRAYERSERATGETSRETQNLRIRLNNATTTLNNLRNELNRTNRELTRSSSGWSRVSQVMTNAGKKMQVVGDKMKSVGMGLTTSLTLPILGVGTAVTKAALDFEQGMANVGAVSNATSEEMKKLKDLAIKMGIETKYSATEAASGIEELSKAGLTTTQILNGGLKGALSLATAGELELSEAAEIASTALNAFREDNLSVSNAADILAGAANSSATSVSVMRYSLAAVSAVASSVGMSFKDTSTAIAVFAQNGLKGSDAGTSLKTMLMNLQPTTKAQKEEFKKLGLVTKDGASKFYDAKGQLKSMADVAGILRNSMKGMSDAQRQAAMRVMFGSDAIRAANILYKEGADGINNMQKAMSRITADEVAAKKMATLKGKMRK